ncbi:MAG: class I SAM-dependent methyltransferase [bacterium]|nr:class I SAM-dependent methyltransferase [bacterium]
MKQNPENKEWIKKFYDSAVDWWGESWYDGENLKGRLELIRKYIKNKSAGILELGAGTGETAAYLAENGYKITAVELSRKNIGLIKKYSETRKNLLPIEGDFLSVKINKRFDGVCIFESFGFGTDQDQRRLLKRISKEWLKKNGIAILDAYHPFGPIKNAGKKIELDRLENIPGSVDMTEYSYFDAIKSRWIDIWEPKNDKRKKRMQSIRCYSPADFLLLVDGTGLSCREMIFNNKKIDFKKGAISLQTEFENNMNNYAYTVILEKQ